MVDDVSVVAGGVTTDGGEAKTTVSLVAALARGGAGGGVTLVAKEMVLALSARRVSATR